MQNADLYRLLNHYALPAALAAVLRNELDYGAANDTRLLLAAAVEGLCAETVVGFHRLLVLEPLPAARSLVRMEIIGHRLWTATEQQTALRTIDAKTSLSVLLDYWCRARRTYRTREKAEAAAKVHYADGRAADLTTLKTANHGPLSDLQRL